MTSKEQKVDATSVFFVLCALYFMWGFITVLNFGLLDFWKNTNDGLDSAKVLFLIFVFFIVYFLMAIPAGKIINKLGFRKGLVLGAVISGIGCFSMFPAVSAGFYAVAGSLFIMATGITILQVAANPFVVLMGSGPARLSLCGGFNSLGAFLATSATGMIGKHLEAMYQNMDKEQIVANTISFVQTPYLILGAVWLLVAAVLAFSNLPTVMTHEMEPMMKHVDHSKSIMQFPHVLLGAIGIFAYVGVEVAMANYLGGVDAYMSMSTGTVARFASYYFMAMMIGRFVGAVALYKIDAPKLNTIFATLAAIFVVIFVLSFNESNIVEDKVAYYLLVALGFLNSILYPVVFSLGIDGLGKYTEEGSSLMIMGIGGGAIIPFLFTNLIGVEISSTMMAFGVIALCYVFIAYYTSSGYKYEKK